MPKKPDKMVSLRMPHKILKALLDSAGKQRRTLSAEILLRLEKTITE
jgi:hypothetical protein